MQPELLPRSRRLALPVILMLAAGSATAAPIFIVQHGPDPSVVGQGIVVSTRIDAVGTQPTGVITIGDGTDSCTVTLPEGSCLWTPTTAGLKSLTADYPGDVNFLGSQHSVAHTVEDVQFPERVSLGEPFLSFDPSEALDGPETIAFSADGRFVAFISTAALIPSDINAYYDVYFLDRHSGALSIVSLDSAGMPADNDSSQVAISPDGRYVAFTTDASNLVAGDTNNIDDVFLRDRVAGTTVRVSVDETGGQAAQPSGGPDVSADGRRIVFKSLANLATADTNLAGTYHDVYLRDLDAVTTTLISVNQGGGTTNNDSFHPSISDDGTRIAFLSSADDLLPTIDTNGNTIDAFLRDVPGNSTELITLSDSETQNISLTDDVVLTPDGTKALIITYGTLDPLDTNSSVRDCYLRDLVNDTTVLVSLKDDDTGPSASAPVDVCAFADNGAVYFLSTADDLVTDTDESNSLDLFKRDLAAGSTTRITGGATDGLVGTLLTSSDDGRQVAFETFNSLLVPGSSADVAVYSSNTGGYSGLNVDRRGNQSDRNLSAGASISADGNYVAFVSTSTNLVPEKRTSFQDIFVRDRATGETTRVSVASDGTEANGNSFQPVISADGRHVAFLSGASNLVPGDVGSMQDVFVHDRQSGTTQRVSVSPTGTDPDGHSQRVAISADGRYVAFETDASNLLGAGNDNNGVSDIFRWDRTQPLATAIARISVTDVEAEANGASDHVTLSSDGNKVLFASVATNLLVAGSATGQIFLRDVAAGTTVQVSLTEGGGPASTPSYGPRLSGDGNTAAFWATLNSNLAPSLIGTDRLLRRDLISGEYDSVLDVGGQPITTAPNRYANLSADGRYFALVTDSNLDPAYFTVASAIFVYDFETGSGRVVLGPNGNSPQTAGATTFAVTLSGDGLYVTTGSGAGDLVTGDSNSPVEDLFLFENPAFALDLEQQVEAVAEDANDDSLAPVSDASGELVVFQSQASNLSGVDGNGTLEDIFSVDTSTGATERLSTNNDGTPLTGAAIDPSVSGDGQIAVFVAEDSGINNVFGEPAKRTSTLAKAGGFSVLMRNRISNTTQRMAIPAQPSGLGTAPQIAPSGNAIVYSAPNTNAVLGAPGQVEVFKIPLERVGNMLMPGAPQCVSCKARDAAGNVIGNSDGNSRAPAVSADGQWVAWETTAKNLTPTPSPCTQASTQIVLRNLVTNTIQRIGTPPSANDCGAAGTGARNPKIDWPGRKIVFESDQPLKPGDANAAPDIYLVDLDSNRMTRVSETEGGGDANGASTEPTISGDGQVIGYVSAAGNLDPEADTNGQPDVHVRNYRDALLATRRLSRTRSGDEADSASRRPAMNYNGTRVAFDSDASNLAPGAQGGVQHVFQRANPLTGEVVFSTGFE